MKKPGAWSLKPEVLIFRSLVACGCFLCVLCNYLNAEGFIYDSHGKRDPFSPPVLSDVGKTDIDALIGVKLEGIIWDEKSPLAIINDKIVGVGEEIAGAKVVEIKENEVVFSVNGQEIKLKLRIKDEGE